MDWESGMSGCKRLYTQWINNKVLLSCTEKYIQYPVINHNRKEYKKEWCCCSVTQSCPTLRCHGLQHAKHPCPSPFPKISLSLCPLHQRCHQAILSSDALFSFCPQSFPASGTFTMSRIFTSDHQNTGASTSASVLPMSIQC